MTGKKKKRRYVKVQRQGGSRVITVRELPEDWQVVSVEVIKTTEDTVTLRIGRADNE